jgi:hypothetical protein
VSYEEDSNHLTYCLYVLLGNRITFHNKQGVFDAINGVNLH